VLSYEQIVYKGVSQNKGNFTWLYISRNYGWSH